MFRHLRSKIILSFCFLMIAGGAITTSVISRSLSASLSQSVDRSGAAYGRAVATQLGTAIAYHDQVAIRRQLIDAKSANPDVVYLFVTGTGGRVTDHSFPRDGFPADLVEIARRTSPTTLRVEHGLVRDLPVAIAEGTLGSVHVGLSTSWVEASTSGSVTNVLLVTGLAMLVGIAGILLLAHLITQPMLGLMGAAKRLGSGDHDSEAPVTSSDEFATLAITFNKMASQIRERMAESEDLRAYVQRILDNMPAGVLVVNDDLKIEYANEVMTEAHGKLVGSKWRKALDGERPVHEGLMTGVLSDGNIARQTFEAQSGKVYELTYVPMVGRDGRRSVVETAVDVTEERRLQDRLLRTERIAVAGEIAAGVVHTINNPLDGIRRALEVAAHRVDKDTAGALDMIAIAREGTERLVSVTRTLLGLARADDQPSLVAVDVPSIIAQATELVQVRASRRGLNIEIREAPDLALVRVNPQTVVEVLVNLLINAVDATAENGTITVTAEMSQGEVLISVKDAGVGIDPEIVGQIFEPFFTTKEVGAGTGLGLSLARRIIETHGGTIEVESLPDHGTTFFVRLPMMLSSAQDESSDPSEEPHPHR